MSEEIEEMREAQLDRWERVAPAWGKRAADVREHGMPVSMWMIDRLALQPGHRLLELAAGPGDTGFLAAELVKPGGALISSDATEGMLAIARERAGAMGIDNVDFKQLQLEWIDLPTASVDAVLCRWGVMLTVDREASAREIRRVLAPGGQAALAVWDEPAKNPWATIPGRTMVDAGHMTPPDPDAPGMFSLSAPGALQELLESAGFVDVTVAPVEIVRDYGSPDEFVEETLDLSMMFADAYAALGADEQAAVRATIAEKLTPFATAEGRFLLPGCSLVAHAS